MICSKMNLSSISPFQNIYIEEIGRLKGPPRLTDIDMYGSISV